MKKIEVSGCKDCPFFATDWSINDPRYCEITYNQEDEKKPAKFLPNCPLKEGKVVVEIKTKKEENKNG
jgi:hypothetical protein